MPIDQNKTRLKNQLRYLIGMTSLRVIPSSLQTVLCDVASAKL